VLLVARFSSPLIVAISMFTVVVATIAVNIGGKRRVAGNDFANAFPRFIGFKTRRAPHGILASSIQPWRLLADPSGTSSRGCSATPAGSVDRGRPVADYWLVRRRELKLEDLYLVGGAYRVERARDLRDGLGWRWRGPGS